MKIIKKNSKESVPNREFLTSLAKGAGAVLMKYFNKKHQVEIKPGAGIVTEADKASETYLLKNIFRRFPKSSIITEETGEYLGDSGLLWILDPLDGTSNYAHGFPWFCVSIGLYLNGKPKAGVIYQPFTRELYFAEKGKGAFLNGKRIQVSQTGKMAEALLGTGFYYSKGRSLKTEIDVFSEMNELSLAVRRPGSAALDLACVASGRFDGFWERGLSSWDVAAGFLMVEEAGGTVTNYQGKKTSMFEKYCLATNGRLHKRMQSIVSRIK
ncbi:MAG: inositol monophosphatase family protein [Proteobacteria bacterium]|nr:inositol monophosphatase family protein [Pseudomonadota bacterium]NQW45396.1 inositol monophosphatase [Deltaproteobacteria bacterium]